MADQCFCTLQIMAGFAGQGTRMGKFSCSFVCLLNPARFISFWVSIGMSNIRQNQLSGNPEDIKYRGRAFTFLCRWQFRLLGWLFLHSQGFTSSETLTIISYSRIKSAFRIVGTFTRIPLLLRVTGSSFSMEPNFKMTFFVFGKGNPTSVS
jgi:hypothetical protein